MIGDRVDRAPPPATVHGATAVAAQHEQPQEPLGGGRTALAASAHPAPAVAVQGGQAQPILRSDRVLSSQAFREVTFAESVREFAEEDAASSSSEKAAVSVSSATFSDCCISSVPVLPRSLLLRRARCVILRGFLLRRTPLPP